MKTQEKQKNRYSIPRLNNKCYPSKCTEKQCKKIFSTAVKIIERSGAPIEDKQALKSRAMTDQILTAYDGEKI